MSGFQSQQSQPAFQSAQAGSPSSVQHAFVNCRLREINSAGNRKELVDKTVEALRSDTVVDLSKAKAKDLILRFGHLALRLWSADLTINFEAPKWFLQENPYDSYSQMYERAIKQTGFALSNNDKKNPARIRAGADDMVTFPPTWVTVNDVPQGKASYNRTVPGLPDRGLSPDALRHRVLDKMSPGSLQPVHADKRDDLFELEQEYAASNPQFDPKTKQIFAALNYGRRPHGASTRYGHSYMVLNPKFKTNAVYFAGDTFLALTGARNSAVHQLSYDLLGAVYLKANLNLRRDLSLSCLLDSKLLDTDKEELLIESHVFEPLEFRGGLTTLYISNADGFAPDYAPDDKQRLNMIQWNKIVENAGKFARKHGVGLIEIR
jgi:hypothetical protein